MLELIVYLILMTRPVRPSRDGAPPPASGSSAPVLEFTVTRPPRPTRS
jgi:hypothetical protein